MSDIEQTTSQQLFNHLYEGCNILRGPINQDEFKSYITPILFFKRISDVYDEETVQALKETEGDEELSSLPEYHSFVIPEGCHWNDVREKSENVGKAIVDAMTSIEQNNPDTLSGVFSSFDDANWTDKTKLDDARLKNLVEHFSKIKVGNNNYSADVMGDAYEFLIKKFADLSKKNAGEFYTPRSIVKLLVMLMDPKPGETVYDPACGSGAFLNAALQFLKTEHALIDELNAKLYGDSLIFQEVENAILENNLFGVDINEESVEIAKLSLWLHTAQKGRKLSTLNNNIKCGNSLIDDVEIAGEKAFCWEKEFPEVFEDGGFDVVIGNPPYVNMVNILDENHRKFYQTHYKTVKNKSDLYSIFTEKSSYLLKSKGQFGFIFSNSWMGTESFSSLKPNL